MAAHIARLIVAISAETGMCTHQRLPVSVLQHNLVAYFESVAKRNSHSLHAAVAAGKIVPQIEYVIGPIPPRAPMAHLTERTIWVHESYLGYLWAYVYANFVIYEKGVQEKLLNRTFSGAIEFDTELLRRAKLLDDWAKRFASKFEPWDEQALPNPRTHATEEERVLAHKVNNILIRAITYVLLHEYAHLYCGHYMSKDAETEREQEKEADNFALSFLVDSASDESERITSGASLVLLCSSNLFLAPEFRAIFKRKHPNSHDRLRHALSGLNLTSEASKYYLYYLASVAIKRFLDQHGLQTDILVEETAEDLFHRYLDLIDAAYESRSRNLDGSSG